MPLHCPCTPRLSLVFGAALDRDTRVNVEQRRADATQARASFEETQVDAFTAQGGRPAARAWDGNGAEVPTRQDAPGKAETKQEQHHV
jgi:hypothetical protein